MLRPRSIHRLAIANRGEAAVRCIRAVQSLRAEEREDMRVIALYTDVDRDAPFVRHADYAVALRDCGSASAAYLNYDAVLEALLSSRADAVWPGWGFLAEDPEFIQRVTDAGILFLGPPPEAARKLGDKIASKQLALDARVPVVPWSGGVLTDVDEATRHAERIGYPVVLKASAGGGGRGIRVVEGPEDLAEAFRSASAEASNAFGDDRLLCEKRIGRGRHIEVQMAADVHGNAISLGLRDCSVQRRHQKVVEEAPPPGLDPKIRAELEAAAVRLAEQAAYVGVGTVEFLVENSKVYFLEVNPRLQVEHGLTEELTGVDLVQLQIRIARGESIKTLQVSERGTAIEARVCAEDPDADFIPSPGRVARFDAALGPRVRVDSGVATGSEIPGDFDSLIAKVIATGESREEARARLSCALRDLELVVEGGATNKGYLLQLLDADEFRAGGVDTGWLERWSETRAAPDPGQAQDALVAAAIVAYQRARAAARTNFYADTSTVSPDRIPPSIGQEMDLSYEGESYRLVVYAIGAWRYRIHLDGRAVAASMREEGAHRARLVIDDRMRRIVYDATEMGLRLEVDGHPHRFGWQTAGQVRAPSPAVMVVVHVAPGDRVEAGQTLGLIEAMKTEIAFRAPVAGVVSEVRVRAGQQIAAGEVLLVVDPAADDEPSSAGTARRVLAEQVDPLALLFRGEAGDPLAVPDLESADAADPSLRSRAIDSMREEVRRLILGYDANSERGERLAAFLEAPVPTSLSADFRRELAEIRHELEAFADVEQLFIRAPRASVSGELGPSNSARLQTYVRRLHASGSGMADEFLALVRRALGHYGETELEPSDSLERAVLRLLASQQEPDLRRRLVEGVLGRVTELAGSVEELAADRILQGALYRISGMRGLVPDSLADGAMEASYVIFEAAAAERRAEQTSIRVANWLESSERSATPPPGEVLLELAAAPRPVFDRVGDWIVESDTGRRAVALAAHVQRCYAPRIPLDRGRVANGNGGLHHAHYPGCGEVVAAIANEADVVAAVGRLVDAAKHSLDDTGPYALELFVPDGQPEHAQSLLDAVREDLGEGRLPCRLTLTLLGGSEIVHETLVPTPKDGVRHQPLHQLHPEMAERIDIARLEAFDLERLSGEEGIIPFYGVSREVPGDERVFVLADGRGSSALPREQVAAHIREFEQVFHRSTRSLRGILQERDPGRRLQWNRICIFVASEIFLERETAADLARRLAPATRHLGLEKVLVRLNLLQEQSPDARPQSIEIVIQQPTAEEMEISWRPPHRAPLQPVQDYERKLVAARRRRLAYPYLIIGTLTSGASGEGESAIPAGSFEEYDLDPKADAEKPRAISVGGRASGLNSAAVVFGVMTTPTQKVPEGMQRVLLLSDPTMGMGSLAARECARIVAAIDLAEELNVPLEWLPISAGAKIAMDSGTENLDATARVVRRIVTFTEAGGVIHVIVQGVNVGAQSYFDALATMLMHTRGVLIMTPRASMVLTGQAALAVSGAVSAEDEVALGGYERIMGPNGQAQYYARTLGDAFRILYEYYDYSYVVPGESGPRLLPTSDSPNRSICETELVPDEACGFASVGEIFEDEKNPGRKRPFPMRAVMKALIDCDGGHLERWRSMFGAETSIVWDAHLGGHATTVIGIESQPVTREGYRPLDGPGEWTGGTLFPLSSKKIARAINSASANRPVIVLANLSGFDGSPESLRKLQLEYGAEIARAVVNFEGPILFVVVSRYHGGAYVVFSQQLNDSLSASALTGSYASVIGGSAAAAVVFPREVRKRALTDPRVTELSRRLRLHPSLEARAALETALTEVRLEKQAELASEFDQVHSVERALEVGSIARIFGPDRLRAELIGLLEAQRS